MKLNSGDKESLLAELRSAGAVIKADGREIKCPFHDDQHASGGVYQGDDGTWRYKCHAGSCGFCGDAWDVLAKAESRPLGEIIQQNAQSSMAALRSRREATVEPPKLYDSLESVKAACPGEVEQVYVYTNPATREPDMAVVRFRKDGKKNFWQASPHGGGWILKRPEGKLPLYNRIAVAGSEVVVCVEGEKCVHALRSSGFAGTTSPMGAGKALYADWSPLAGKMVYLWPDHDEAGVKHMQDVAEILSHLDPAARVLWIEPKGLNLPAKGDVADFVAGLDLQDAHDAVAAVLDTASSLGAAGELEELLENTISGKRSCVTLPWGAVHHQSRALMPDTITVLCGAAGSSKSFAVLQCLRHWYENGVKAAAFELEEDRAYHLNRLLAQEAETAELTNTDWVRACPDETRRLMALHRPIIEAIGRMLYTAPSEQVDYAKLVEWTEARAKEGCRVIVIDPVTAVAPARDPWIADSQFIFHLKAISRKYGPSIILVTHPRKGRGKSMGMDDLAGGAAFQRFTQTVLWLESFKKLKKFTVSTPCGKCDVSCNRMVYLHKCRNGPGTESLVAMLWDGRALKLAEQGIVVKECKDGES